MLILRGGAALSAFRVAKINDQLASDQSPVRVDSTYYAYLVQLKSDLSEQSQRVLMDLLAAEDLVDTQSNAQLCVVSPRLGTISPWSSKATDIAKHCDIHAVARIERALVFELDGDIANCAVPAVLYDRMTESAVTSWSGLGAGNRRVGEAS